MRYNMDVCGNCANPTAETNKLSYVLAPMASFFALFVLAGIFIF